MNRTTEPALRVKHIDSSLAVVIILFCISLLSGQALGQSVNWTQLAPTDGPPSSRVSPTAVIDPFNNMIVFGGFGGTVGVPPMFNDVWVLSDADGNGSASTWTQLTPSGVAPAGRGYHSAVYDHVTNSMIIFGGDLSVGFCFASTNDVWVLANANGTGGTPTWTQLSPAGVQPSARDNDSAVYDSASNRMIVFGGQVECSSQFDEIWVLANANGIGGTPTWTQLSPSGPGPGARAGHSAVYDSANNRMIVFGGGTSSGFLNDVWVLANANGLGGAPTWMQLAPTGPLPSVTSSHSAIYDPVANTMTVFGGSTNAGFTDKVWLLTNANGMGGTPAWTQLKPTGGSPGARYSHSAVFNPSTGRMIIFGGADPSGAAHNDTWVLSSLNAPLAEFEVRDLDIPCDRGHDQDKDDMRFGLSGEFTVGATSKGIDPAHEAVTLSIGSFSLSIPAGSFRADHDNDNFRFEGTINGMEVEFDIRAERHNHQAAPEFRFRVEAKGANLSSQANPVTVSLTIGNNTGSVAVQRQGDCDNDQR